MPDLPWRLARRPQVLEHVLVPQRVHRLPEAAVLVRHYLPEGDEADERRAFPASVVAGDHVEAFRRQHEITAVDETAVARRLLGESDDGVAPALDRAVAAGRPHRRDRGELAVAVMEADQFADVHIADTVAIGEAEGILAGQMRADALEAAAGLRVLAGVNERHAPGF